VQGVGATLKEVRQSGKRATMRLSGIGADLRAGRLSAGASSTVPLTPADEGWDAVHALHTWQVEALAQVDARNDELVKR
jgi:hypothetical protein